MPREKGGGEMVVSIGISSEQRCVSEASHKLNVSVLQCLLYVVLVLFFRTEYQKIN